MTPAKRALPMAFDGQLFWYVERYDPEEDRCSFCRELIPEDDVPLILFQERGAQTWMARLHLTPCADTLIAAGHLKMPS